MNVSKQCCGGWLAVAAVISLWAGSLVRSQGNLDPIVLQTGGGHPLVSAFLPLGTIAPSNSVPLEFEFAFGTDEAFAPGQIFDAFTITLQVGTTNHTAVLLTADVSGAFWAPPSPGALVVDSDSIVRTAIDYPSGQPVFDRQFAFQVSLPLPVEFHGQPANLFLDLFDNLDTVASQGYFRLIVVPEPASWALLAMGGLAWLLHYSRKRR